MHSKRLPLLGPLLVTLLMLTVIPAAGVPGEVTFQGFVDVNGTPFNGTGTFRFALVDAAGTTSYWSNDGTSVAGSEPTAGVPLQVFEGIFTVPLGDTDLTNMTAIPPAAFDNDDVLLRIWFDDGAQGSQLLTPDQNLTTVPFAVRSGSVEVETQNLGDVLGQGNDAGGVAITGLADPTAAGDAATRGWVEANTDASETNEIQNLGSVLGQGNDAGSSKITNLGAPTADGDAATKKYVDDNGGASVQQMTFASVAPGGTVTVTGTSVVAVYQTSPTVGTGPCARFPVPYPGSHVFDMSTAKASDRYTVTPDFEAWLGVDPSLPRTGNETGNAWGTAAIQSNAKFNFDLGTARTPTGIWLENWPPTDELNGVQRFNVWGTNSAAAFNNLDYANTNSLTFLGGPFDAVVDAEEFVEQPQCFNFSNSTAYRYIVLRLESNHGGENGGWIGFRHVQMTTTTPIGAVYTLLTPGVDYTVTRTAATGSQTLTIQRLGTGNASLVVDYF